MAPQDPAVRNPRALLLLGVAAFAVLGALFVAIAENVATGDPIGRIDRGVAVWLHGHGNRMVTSFMLAATHLHSTAGILAMSAVLAAYLVWKRAWHWVASVLVAVGGGLLLNALWKEIYQRARPSWDDPLLTLTTYSFPSGHTAGATLFYGLLAAYLVTRLRSPVARIACVAGPALMVALVGFSRMYLGVHYLSDVVGAACAGAAWLALCLLAVHHVGRRHPA